MCVWGWISLKGQNVLKTDSHGILDARFALGGIDEIGQVGNSREEWNYRDDFVGQSWVNATGKEHSSDDLEFSEIDRVYTDSDVGDYLVGRDRGDGLREPTAALENVSPV